jgi:hypothetical protein
MATILLLGEMDGTKHEFLLDNLKSTMKLHAQRVNLQNLVFAVHEVLDRGLTAGQEHVTLGSALGRAGLSV